MNAAGQMPALRGLSGRQNAEILRGFREGGEGSVNLGRAVGGHHRAAKQRPVIRRCGWKRQIDVNPKLRSRFQKPAAVGISGKVTATTGLTCWLTERPSFFNPA